MRRTVIFLVTLSLCLVTTFTGGSALAAGRGEGGCVVTPKAPIYESSKSADAIGFAGEGECVAGVTTTVGGLVILSYQFEELDGRMHATFMMGALPTFSPNNYLYPKFHHAGTQTF